MGEYLDHNELGLAFELIVYELDRLEVSRPADDALGGGESALEPECRVAWERAESRDSSWVRVGDIPAVVAHEADLAATKGMSPKDCELHFMGVRVKRMKPNILSERFAERRAFYY